MHGSLSDKILVASVIWVATISTALAQTEAEVAFQKAKVEFANQRFAAARDLLTAASQTDTKNPDIFLLKGKSHYQLGELDEALAAWRRTLQLAPAQAYAKQMTESLQGRLRDVDVRLKVIGSLLDGNLPAAAQVEIAAARRSSLSDAQLGRLLSLEAETLVELGQADAALKSLRELAIRDPQQKDTARTRLLTGRAMIALKHAAAANGLAMLESVKADFADSPEAAAAELALIVFRIRQGEPNVQDLIGWITAYPAHPAADDAQQAMVESVGIFLAESARDVKPTKDAALNDADKAALSAAEQAFASLIQSSAILQLAEQWDAHLQKKFVANRAFATAGEAVDRLLAAQRLPASKRLFQQTKQRLEIAVASAELDELLFALDQSLPTTDGLQAWLAANPDHPRVTDGRRRLLTAHLQTTRLAGVATATAELSPSDVDAIVLAGELLASKKKTAAESLKLIQPLLGHFKSHYTANGAFGATITGQQRLLELPLPPPVRLTVWNDLAEVQMQAALTRLRTELAAGREPPRQLPADLAAATATFDAITAAFPATGAWGRRSHLAAELLKLSGTTAPVVTQILPMHSWVLDIALPVIGGAAKTDAKTVAAAIATANAVVDQTLTLQHASARGLATRTQQRLLDAIPESYAAWPVAVMRQLNLRMLDSHALFQERTRTGQGRQNAALDDEQKEMLALASQLLTQQPASAASLLQKIDGYLKPWAAEGHGSVIEQAYVLLEAKLPPAQQRHVRLAVAKAWKERVLAEHQRLLDRGFQPPRELDATLEKALVRCYELQSALVEGHPQVAEIQAVRQGVIDHYRNLEYFDAAAVAIKVKAEQIVGWIDTQAELESAKLQLDRALQELERQAAEFPGREQIALTPALREAIASLQKFITDRPASPLVSTAVDRWFDVGKRYESHKKFAVAADIYRQLETFAKQNNVLTNTPPGVVTAPERAAHAIATTLHVAATDALVESNKNRPENVDPPIILSDEFGAAIAAYEKIIADYPSGTLVGPAIGKIMEVGLQHANAGEWEVAESVYAELQKQKLPLREPARLDLARALCQIGKVMPAHAVQVLSAITLWERTAPVDGKLKTPMLAMLSPMNEKLEQAAGFGGGMLQGEGSALTPVTPQPKGDAKPGDAKPSDANPSAATALPAGGPAKTQPPPALDIDRARREVELLAAVRRQQSSIANRIAMMRDQELQHLVGSKEEAETPVAAASVLTDEEIQRQQSQLDKAYATLQTIRRTYPRSTTAGQAREEMMGIVNHWRSIKQWNLAGDFAKRYLADNPRDAARPMIRHGAARDYLAWAGRAVKPEMSKQELLDEVAGRYQAARKELAGIIAAFPDNISLKHQAQWDIANSHLVQARVVAAFSRTLARGQFVRATNELLRTSEVYHDHPNIGQLPQMLWGISQELTSRGFFDEAIVVWNEMTIHYPGHPLADKAALQIAQSYESQLGQPLRAVESYLELNFARGSDVALQDAIFAIASRLTNEKRWVESLHVLETFVDSFPQHAQSGQALTMIGQVHQTNEVWEDAIEAYRRVIVEYDEGAWAQQSKWSIAECTINLSRWEEAQVAYREYQKAYPKDGQVAEAVRRLEILKGLARFQKVVDEPGQRKAFDAQYQIATIVRTQMANRVKAIIEYKKVAANWPESHLADDALYQVGMIYMELSDAESARKAFLATANGYPSSPLADDALFQVGASYERDAQLLAGVTRGKSNEQAKDISQKLAYVQSQFNRREQRARGADQIAQLRLEGKKTEAENKTAFQAARNLDFDRVNAEVVATWAAQQEEVLTTAQLADRQDKINAALRKAVAGFRQAASVTSADKADDALLRMAQIYDQQLKDSDSAMSTWLEIVKQYSGTTVAEDASWKIAQYYETKGKYADAISAYNAFLRNYRRSPKASAAQAAIAENHEHLGNWVEAMDAYTNYINNYPKGNLVEKAKEQIAWIKTYRL